MKNIVGKVIMSGESLLSITATLLTMMSKKLNLWEARSHIKELKRKHCVNDIVEILQQYSFKYRPKSRYNINKFPERESNNNNNKELS